MKNRTTTATALGAAALIALTGCGSGSGSGSDASEGDTVPLADLQKDVEAAMEDAGSGSMTAKAGEEELKGDFEVSDSPQAHLTGDNGGEKLDVRLVDDVYYVKAPSPDMTQKGKSWIKASTDSDDPSSQQLASSLEAMTKLSDPVAAIDGAKDVDAKVSTSDGDETTYKIKLSKKQMAAALKAQAKESGDEQAAQMAEQGAQATTVDLTVDGDDRPVKSVTSPPRAGARTSRSRPPPRRRSGPSRSRSSSRHPRVVRLRRTASPRARGPVPRARARARPDPVTVGARVF